MVVEVVVVGVVVDEVDEVVSGSSTTSDDDGSDTGAALLGLASSEAEQAARTHVAAATAAASRTPRWLRLLVTCAPARCTRTSPSARFTRCATGARRPVSPYGESPTPGSDPGSKTSLSRRNAWRTGDHSPPLTACTSPGKRRSQTDSSSVSQRSPRGGPSTAAHEIGSASIGMNSNVNVPSTSPALSLTTSSTATTPSS